MLKLLKKQSRKKMYLPHFSSKSVYAEAYRTLRANLQFTSIDQDLKSICVTSATAMEGKTNTVANLAYTMALTGKRVLMVDCDLRKPGLTRQFGLKNEPGLTELISQDFGEMVTQGDISDICLNDLIKLNKLQKRTGLLSIFNGSNHVDISFRSGSLTNIFWKNKPEGKKLASALIRNKLLTKEQANLAIKHQKKSGQRLGTILRIMGLISRGQLKKIITKHILEAFKTVASMYDGRFSFANLPGNQVDTTIQHNVDFNKLFHDFLGEESQSPFLIKTIESMIVNTDTKNMFILPTGSIPPNPAEMVSSKRMAFIMEYLTCAFDFVIVDTPPVLPASDVIMTAQNTDGILLVVKTNKVNKDHVKNVVRQIESTGTKILGLILNNVDMKKDRNYRHYKKYYASYYGETG